MEELIPKSRVLLIDGNNVAWRWFMKHQGKQLSTSGGVVTTICYGLVESIIKANTTLEEIIFRNTGMMKTAPYDRVIVCWDSFKNWRKQFDPEYKANRKDPARVKLKEEIEPHMINAQHFMSALHVPQFQVDGLEADDILGILTEHYKNSGWTVTIVSGDKDLHQLLDWGKVLIHDGESTFIDEGTFIEKWKMRAHHWQEAKALMGDDGDNVIGIDGIGEVLSTAIVRVLGCHLEQFTADQVDFLPKISRFTGPKKEALKKALSSGLVQRNLKLVWIPRHYNLLGDEISRAFEQAWERMAGIQPIRPDVFMQVLQMYEMNKHMQNYRIVMRCLGLS